MLLDQVFDKFTPVKWVFVRKNGKLKRIRKEINLKTDPAHPDKNKTLFPISKERK